MMEEKGKGLGTCCNVVDVSRLMITDQQSFTVLEGQLVGVS